MILVGQELHLADQFRDVALIYPTLLKSFAYAFVLACFKVLEEAAVGLYHDEPFRESVAAFAGGSWKGFLSTNGVVVRGSDALFWFHRTATGPR